LAAFSTSHTLSGDGSQSAYECFNIFNVQPTTVGGSSSKDSQPKQSNPENYNIFNVQRKTDVDKSLEDQALESSTAVSNLLGLLRIQELHFYLIMNIFVSNVT
jgi:hypothetical protein